MHFQDAGHEPPEISVSLIEVIIHVLPIQICDRIFQRVTSDSIKCNGSFVRSLYGRICRGGQGGYREIVRDRGWLRGMVWSGRVEILHVCTNDNQLNARLFTCLCTASWSPIAVGYVAS